MFSKYQPKLLGKVECWFSVLCTVRRLQLTLLSLDFDEWNWVGWRCVLSTPESLCVRHCIGNSNFKDWPAVSHPVCTLIPQGAFASLYNVAWRRVTAINIPVYQREEWQRLLGPLCPVSTLGHRQMRGSPPGPVLSSEEKELKST